MSAAKGILVRPSSQAFRIETSFLSSTTGLAVTSGTATASVFEVETDGTLRAVDFSTSPPSVLGASTTVPTTPTISLACQSCAGTAQPYWSATFATGGLTSGGVYLITFSPPSGAATPSPKVVQFGQVDGDLGVSATGQAGVDLSNIKQATAATTLANITIPLVTTATTVTGGATTAGLNGAVSTLQTAIGTPAQAGVPVTLSATGLDAAKGWGTWSARQTLQAIGQILFGSRSGMPAPGTAGTITFTGPSSAAYGTVTVDTNGNITSSNLTPPA